MYFYGYDERDRVIERGGHMSAFMKKFHQTFLMFFFVAVIVNKLKSDYSPYRDVIFPAK